MFDRESLSKIPAEQLAFKSFPAYIAFQHPSYRFSPHNLMIANALERVESGEIKRLIVALPPRHGKTMQIGEFFPAWYIGRNPAHQIIYATYAFERAGDVGRKVRNQMLDIPYQKIFPESKLSLDNRGINRFSTVQGGNVFAVGVGGVITGRGANCLIIDDPHKGRKEVESDAQRNHVIDWYQSVAYTRLMPDNRVILVQTRWHFSDLIGFVLEEMKHEKWYYLKLPAICDSRNDLLNREIGDPLWESDYPLDTLENIRETVGTREWNAQYQQNPLPAEGGLVQLDWFSRYDWGGWAAIEFVLKSTDGPIQKANIPYDISRIVMSLDTAFKESDLNDPSAFTIWGITRQNKIYLLNTINKRMKYPTLKKTTIETWLKYSRVLTGNPVTVLIEDKASGQSLIQDLMSTQIPVKAMPADSSKQIRMSSASPQIESGRVHLPVKSPWLVGYETQIARFPLWDEDDLADSTSQFLNWFSQPKFVKRDIRYWK